jgi:leucyl aminopeptidase
LSKRRNRISSFLKEKTLKITLSSTLINRIEADLLVIPYRVKGDNLAFEALNKSLRGALAELAATEKFKGHVDRTLIWQGRFGGRHARVIVVGVGNSEAGVDAFRTGIGRAVRYASGHQLQTLACFVENGKAGQATEAGLAVEALIMANYKFDKYKSKKQRSSVIREGIIAVHPSAENEAEIKRAIRLAKARATGVVLARDLVNEPANILSPVELANQAESLAKRKKLECTVLGPKEIKAQGMNLLLSVSAGANREPRLIHMVYRPRGSTSARIAFVGKGLTFDSGGLCLKPGKSMYDMKTDMAGAATTLGIMSAVSTLKPNAEIHAIIPATDNSIGANATRPGDVVKSMSGITVEVLNTDAEGRLILADAMTYAAKFKPGLIIDHATLTGACVVALGSYTGGLFSTDDSSADQYLLAAKSAGELFWPLPLAKELERTLRSDVADIKNIGGPYGGAITAALFLKRFAKKTPWIHVDMAGPGRADRSSPTCHRGGTGFGVLTALDFLQGL